MTAERAASTDTVTITLTVPLGITEDEAQNVAYAALTEAKTYFDPDAEGFAVEWFDIKHNDGGER